MLWSSHLLKGRTVTLQTELSCPPPKYSGEADTSVSITFKAAAETCTQQRLQIRCSRMPVLPCD